MIRCYEFCKPSEHLKNVLKLIDFEGTGGARPGERDQYSHLAVSRGRAYARYARRRAVGVA